MIYYEIIFNKTPTFLVNKKRQSLILTEPYNIRHIFQSRKDIENTFREIGLPPYKIKNKRQKTIHFLGFRDKFEQ